MLNFAAALGRATAQCGKPFLTAVNYAALHGLTGAAAAAAYVLGAGALCAALVSEDACGVAAAAPHFAPNLRREDGRRAQGLGFFAGVQPLLLQAVQLGKGHQTDSVRRQRQALEGHIENAWVSASKVTREQVAVAMGYKPGKRGNGLTQFDADCKAAYTYRQHAYIPIAAPAASLRKLLMGPMPKNPEIGRAHV